MNMLIYNVFSKYIHYIKKEDKKRGQFLNKEFYSSEVDMTPSDKLVA